jgi:tyrosine phenol-lyase
MSPRVVASPEPWRVKVVEPIRLPSAEERERHLTDCGYNVFRLPSEAVFIDLLTDSGTSAQSDRQWAGLVSGDEAYAGGRCWYTFERTVQQTFGLPHVVPTHQGRAAERLLFTRVVHPGDRIPNNRHFDTTRANLELLGGEAVDLPSPVSRDPATEHPFKGDMDLDRLESLLADAAPQQVPLVLLTLTDNAGGGQPVSLANVRAVGEICRRHGVPFWIDACRFAENAFFIREREPEQQRRSVAEIVHDVFAEADGCLMSAKKDGLANIGGFLACRDRDLAERLREALVVTEGYATYGGLAGRDLAAVAVGLREVLDERYLAFRVGQVRWLGERMEAAGIPIVRPPGGHAIYVDAGALLPHLPPERFPGQALTVALYRHGGVRGVEIGSVMFGREDPSTGAFAPAEHELVRLAVPRRVYSHNQLGYVVRVLEQVRDRAEEIRGLRIVHQPEVLRHFTARFEEVEVDVPLREAV